MFLESLGAAFLVALLSVTGVFVFGSSGRIQGAHRYILPFAVGVFLAVVIFELIPETIELSHEYGPVAIVLGFLGFYLLSHFLNTFHHHHREHNDDCANARGGARKLLLGDAVHNVADGVVIATAFIVHPALGIATTVGIALHEVPQEIAEFGVLMHAGYTKKRAVILNLISASSILLGVVLTYAFMGSFGEWLFILTGIAAGNLLYIATADLLPELQHSHKDHFWKTFLTTLFGVVLIASLIHISHESFGELHEDEGVVYED